MLEAHGTCEKEQMAGVMHMLRAVVHAVVFAVGPLDRKNAQVTSESKIFDGLIERSKTEPNEQRSDRNEQSDENNNFDFQSGVRKVGSLVKNGVGRSPNMCFPQRAASTFQKMMPKGR